MFRERSAESRADASLRGFPRFYLTGAELD